MGITDLELEQALQRQEALWQARLVSICRQVNEQINEALAGVCVQVNEQANAGFARMQHEVTALRANPSSARTAPTINVTVPERQVTVHIAQHPKRAVQVVERDPDTNEITRTETDFED